jgi:Zn-dependent protease
MCVQCHALVHAAELEKLAAEAKALEAKGELRPARERWLTALPLLPPTSNQFDWIVEHARTLAASADAQQPLPSDGGGQILQLRLAGPAASQIPGAIQPKPHFKWTFLLSFLIFVVIYSAASGVRFGLGFALLILIHEMGHFIDIKRRGLPADMPVFLPGLGAYVRWQALGVSLETRAAVSLAGPLAGFLASVVCAALWWQTHTPLWADLARVGAILNLLNLIPVWVLDGGQAVLALSKIERIALLTAALALWLVLQENMLILVALGAGYQAFLGRNLPARPSRLTTIYYIAVLAALGFVIRLMPGQGLGLR